MIKYLMKYGSIIGFIVISIVIETLGVLITDKGFVIADSRFFLTLVCLFSLVLFLIKNDKLRHYLSVSILVFQALVNIGFVLLFETSGEYFSFSQLYLTGDASGILENIPLNFWFTIFLMIALTIYFIYGKRFMGYIQSKKIELPIKRIYKNSITLSLIVLMLCLNFFTAHNIKYAVSDPYMNMLTSTNNGKYQTYGITGNLLNEMYQGVCFDSVPTIDDSEIEDYIYNGGIAEVSDYFGVSAGNNVVIILGETLEWFGFISDLNKYPYGIDLSDSEIRQLFPNFYRLFDNSLVLDNYHVKEKTDISEMMVMMGSYPTNKFINYNYMENTIPNTITNVLRDLEGLNYANNYHNNVGSFYNRNKINNILGFDNYYATEELSELFPDTFTDYGVIGERNLDSEMFESAKDLMFVDDERFVTYALTMTMHGMYSKRENLDKHHEYLKQFNINIDEKDLYNKDVNRYNFYSYLACMMELEESLGIIFDDLEEKNILHNTSIVLFGDHNAYYQGLSSYVKDIKLGDDNDYMDLYRVPVMIYDEKLMNKMRYNNDNRIIDKFTTVSDVVMTLFDILGINVYQNLYYGSSALTSNVSVGYSRSYGIFFTDDAYFRNINSIIYSNKRFLTKKEVEDYMQNEVLPDATILIDKIRYTDQIYRKDYFGNKNNYDLYLSKLKEIQGY